MIGLKVFKIEDIIFFFNYTFFNIIKLKLVVKLAIRIKVILKSIF